MSTTFERLCAILVKEHQLGPERLTLQAPLDSLGIDSLGTVELLWNVETAFKIKLPTDPVGLVTLADVVRFVDELAAAQGVQPAAAPVSAPVFAPAPAPASASASAAQPAAPPLHSAQRAPAA